jgi:uncharacterized protein (TIGR02145 family)
MPICNNQYPTGGTPAPNPSVGTSGPNVSITSANVEIIYPTIIINNSTTGTQKQWFAANLVGAEVFTLNFLPSDINWFGTLRAASPADNGIGNTEAAVLNNTASAKLCESGFLYKPDCIQNINNWLASTAGVAAVGAGWRVATQADFEHLLEALDPLSDANSTFKLRNTSTSGNATINTQWLSTSTAPPAGVTLNYSGFNAFAAGARVITTATPQSGGSINFNGRFVAWWLGPSTPGGTDNQYNVTGFAKAFYKSVSIWNRGDQPQGATNPANSLKFNIAGSSTNPGLTSGTYISNDPNVGNSIRLVRDWVNPDCPDLTTSDALNPTLVAAGAYEPVTFDQTVYPSIWIGAQKWVASNLVETLAPGLTLVDDGTWKTLGDNYVPAYTYCNINTELLDCKQGYLFNYSAGVAINNYLVGQGINQKYRVPSNDDFNELVDYLGGASVAGGKLKSNTPTPTTYWDAPNTGADNSSGFSAIHNGVASVNNTPPIELEFTNCGPINRVGATYRSRDENSTFPGSSALIELTNSSDNSSIYEVQNYLGHAIRLVIPSIPVTIVFAGPGTGSATVTGVDSTITDTGTSGFVIRLRNGEDLTVIATPDSPYVTGSINVTDGVPSGVPQTTPIAGGLQVNGLSEAITVTITFTNPPAPASCNPCTFSQLNSGLTYGSVTVNSVCYPTLQIGSLEVTTYNLTVRDLSTFLFPGVPFITNAAGWVSAGSSSSAACTFTNFANNSLSNSTNENTCATGLLFNHHAIALINAYLSANNPGWRVLTECDAKHIKNRVSIDLSVGCPANGLGVGAINVGGNGLAGNASDECLQNDDFNPSGLGATLMSAGGTTDNAAANNDSGYTLVKTGYINDTGSFSGPVNSNIWTSTSADKQYANGSSTVYDGYAWRGFAADLGSGGETYIDHIPNLPSWGFALRLCQTIDTPYDFTGTHNVSLDTGVLVAGVPISGATSTIDYNNSYGTWRINKCRDIVNNVTATAGINDVAPGWDKLNGTTANPDTGQIVVRFSGIPAAPGTYTWYLPIGCDIIPITREIIPDPGSITDLICGAAASSLTGVLFEGDDASGITFTVSYTGGNGGDYAAQSILSTGVAGLTATLAAGSFASGSGTLTYTLSGTPADGGTASFALSFPGPNSTTVSCTVILDVEEVILITFLGCNSATYTPNTPPFYVSTPLNENISIAYAASNSGEYAGDTFASTGLTGLTLTLNPTTVTSSGSFTGTITGIAGQTGTAIFTICIGGYNGQGQFCCTLSVPIVEIPSGVEQLDCANAVFTGTVSFPGSYAAGNNITITIPYIGGNGGGYPYTAFSSTGITGLTMSAPAGNFAGSQTTPQNGTILFTVIGTPSGIGNAVFDIEIGGQTCQIELPVVELPGDANLNCGAATTSSQVLSGQSVNGITLSIPYTGGNGGTYDSQIIQSTPAGVTASLAPGTLAVGSGVLVLSLTGTMPAGFIPITFQFAFPVGSPACTITLTPPIEDGTADLDCNSLSVVGTITYPDPIPVNNPIILYINYTNSNGGSYPAATFTSALGGVLGLTATLEAGQFALGFGQLQLTVTGTPQSSGTAYFDITIGGTTCTFDIPVEPPIGDIDQLNCNPSSIAVTGTLVNGQVASGVTFTVPYAGSNGGTYPANTANSLSIVTGLTATLASGIFNEPNGTVTYTVTGTPLGSGPATFPITVANQSCTILLTVDPIPGTADLDCANATFSATPVQGFSTSVTGNIPYTNGNGGYYDTYTDTVDGLTLTINDGYFNNGSGSVPFTIQGIPTVSGTITFTNIQVGDQTCNLTITVSEPPPIIDDLLCDQAVITGSLVINEVASGVTITIPYEGSNGQPYPEDSSNSTGITGLTATTPAGVLTDPTGELIYTVTGTPTTSGVATFTITIGTQTCVISIPVSPPNFFGPEEPSPCEEVTYTDPGCEVLTDTCTILFNGTEVVYTTISTTDPCQVSFQVPCDAPPNEVAIVTFLDCEDNIITTEELPIGDKLPSYLSQTAGCPGDEVTLLDTGCTFATSVTNIQVCYPGSTGCISIGPGTLLNSSLPLPCSIAFTIPVPSPAPFYPVDVQIVFEGSSGVLEQFDFTVENCADTENSFEPIGCALPGDEVTFTNPNCNLVSPDFSELLVGGISAAIVSVNNTPPCSVTFLIPDETSSGLQEIQFIDDLGNLLGTEEYSVAAEGVGSNYTVTFTPQIDTCHRIYFRTTQEEYCYYQADGPFEVGVPVTVTIDLQDYAECLVTVPPTSCDDNIIVTGYIQPCCTNEDALDNRVEMNCVQYAATDCGLYSVVCNSSNCGTFTKSNCFASGCTGINDLTEYAFRGNAGIPSNTVYVCSEGNGVQNTTNSTYTITKLSSVVAKAYGLNILQAYPFQPSTIYWTNNASVEWNPAGTCSFVGDHVYVPENTTTGTVLSAVILTVGTTYEFTFSMFSNLANIISFTSGLGNTVSVSSPGGSYPPVGTTYQITAGSTGRLSISIPSVGKGTCFQLTGLRVVQTGIRATCCTCFGAEVILDLPEDGPTSIEVYYTQCTDDGPQIATTTLTNSVNVINCCTYGSVFPVNRFDVDYITSLVYLINSGC